MTKHHETEAEHPIFIVGNVHAGTTLLGRIIGRHSHIYCPRSETAFFECVTSCETRIGILDTEDKVREMIGITAAACASRIWEPYKPYEKGFLDQIDAEWRREVDATVENILKELKGQPVSHPSIFPAVMHYYARLHRKRRWAEKNPAHIFYADAIKAACPSAAFVHIVRDPKDLLASYGLRDSRWRAGQKPNAQDDTGCNDVYDPLTLLLGWKSVIRAGMKIREAYPSDYYEVKFEDLVLSPEVTLQRLCDFLHLSFEGGMLNVHAFNPADARESKAPGFNRRAVGRSEEQLTKKELGLCARICQPELVHTGYTAGSESLSTIEMLPFVVRFGMRSFRRLRGASGVHDCYTAIAYLRKQLRRIHHLSRGRGRDVRQAGRPKEAA